MDTGSCNREPIHIPGAIQPHGVLLVVTPDDRIIQSAGDVARVLGFNGPAVGRGFDEVVGRPLASLISGEEMTAAGEPLFLGSFRNGDGSSELDILAQPRAQYTIVELEPSHGNRRSAAGLLAQLRAGAHRIKHAPTIEAACKAAAVEVALLSGFHRVMTYEFLEDGAGRVVGEAKAEDLPSFLNHHYPAGDIPQQARSLYLRNHVRIIPDVDYSPAPLVGGDPGLDMSDCALRSVSPVHLQYLKNMGVAASMSVSVIREGRLWGLIACHNLTPRFVPYETREACRQVAAALALQLDAIEAQRHAAEIERLAQEREALTAVFGGSDDVEHEVRGRLGELWQLIPSNGIVVGHGDMVLTDGITPDDPASRALVEWARRQGSSSPLATNMLSSAFPDAARYAETASGLLTITATDNDPLTIIWLRCEYAQTIEWAGDPYSKGALSKAGSLAPRTSFEVWRETVRGRSRPWSAAEVTTAGRLRESLERIRERQRISRLQSEVIHMSRVSAMGAMASAIAHELNQPLAAAQNYLAGGQTMLSRAASPAVIEQVVEALGKAGEQTLRAGEIVRGLRQLVAKGPVRAEPCRISEIVRDACTIALLDASRLGVRCETRIKDEEHWVLVDSVQIEQVIINLLRNALDVLEGRDDKRIVVSTCATSDGMVEVRVEDSGPGVSADLASRIFIAFASTKAEGLGVGLSISRTIIEAHRGRIWVGTSRLGGASFSFSLPLATKVQTAG